MRSRLAPAALLWCTVLLLGGCGRSGSPTAPSGGGTPAPAPRVVVLGDSLAVSPTRAEGFPARLQERIDQAGLPWEVLNAGVGGDTAEGGLARLDALLTPDVGVLVVALGANDGLAGTPVDIIERNLAEILDRASRRGVRLLLCGMETPPTRGLAYSLEFHRIYPRLAARFGIPLVPFLLAGVALVPDLNGPDLVHPNAAGARRIAENVWPFLEPLLRGNRATATLEVRLPVLFIGFGVSGRLSRAASGPPRRPTTRPA